MRGGSEEQRLGPGLNTADGKAWDRHQSIITSIRHPGYFCGAQVASLAPCSSLPLDSIRCSATCRSVAVWKDSHRALATRLPLSCFSLSGCTLMLKTKRAFLARLTTTYSCNCSEQGCSSSFLKWSKLNWLKRTSCWTLMFTVGLLDPPSSGRIVQVRAGSNSPHLRDGLHLPPQFDSYSPLLWKADNNVNALYPVLLLSQGCHGGSIAPLPLHIGCIQQPAWIIQRFSS